MIAALVVILALNSVVQAQVTVVRSGQENPVVTIGKSTLYGAGTGLLLGLALTLVVDEDTGDVLKWSFVTGTFGGFLLGIYHVANRPQPSSAALLQIDSNGLAKVQIPEPQIRLNESGFTRTRSLEIKVNLMKVSL